MASTPPPNPDLERRIADFKRDLLAEEDPVDVVRRHITTGPPAHLDESVYFDLRRRISQRLQVHPSAVVLVGSCRLGFTLKTTGVSSRRYRAAKPRSDVDVAVVSEKIFDDLWDRLYSFVAKRTDWAMSKQGQLVARDVFNGWMTPSKLPALPRFDYAEEWNRFFDELNKSRIVGLRRVEARLYRTWARLEHYQLVLVEQCRSELQREAVQK